MALPTHYDSESEGRIAIAEMTDRGALIGRIRKVEKANGGGPSVLLDALRAQLAQLPADDRPRAAAAPPPAAAERAATVHKLQRADGSTTTTKDNNPPPDEDPADAEFRARLEEKYQDLLDRIAEHDLSARKLPKTVESDEDVAAINAWVTTARRFYAEAEKTRKAEKEDYLQAGKRIDSFFAAAKDGVVERAKGIEERSAPYLEAKRVAEAAARQAAAVEAARVAAEQAEAARLAREAQEKADAEAEKARQAIRDAADAETRRLAEVAAREAAQRLQAANREVRAADKDAGKAEKAATKAENRAADPRALERTSGGGGNARLDTVWTARVDDMDAIRGSLGPLGEFIAGPALIDAIGRAGKSDHRPPIPGITYVSEQVSKTTATRS